MKTNTKKNKKIIGNAILIQAGGPTSVINSSTLGYVLECQKYKKIIKNIYISHYGILGLISNNIKKIDKKDIKKLKKLQDMPGIYFGSARHKLNSKDDFLSILKNIKLSNIRYILVNGGNDTMDTCSKLYNFFKEEKYEINIIGIPKTVDNDLSYTYFSPGFLSSVKYITKTISELKLDFASYNLKQVNIVEIMGRNAGHLSLSAYLSNLSGYGPDLIYPPEIPFSYDSFLEDIKKQLKVKNNVLVIVSEGLKTSDNEYIIKEYGKNISNDQFGNANLGGCASILSSLIKKDLNIKSRGIDLSLMQRSANHIKSSFDLKLAFNISKFSVKKAVQNHSGYMSYLKILNGKITYDLVELSKVANIERVVSENIIKEDKIDYDKLLEYFLKVFKNTAKLKKELNIIDYLK